MVPQAWNCETGCHAQVEVQLHMWAWGWLPTVWFAASQWRQMIFIVARNIRSGSGPTANRGSIVYSFISSLLVFYMSLWSWALRSLPSAWLIEFWALPYPFGPTVVRPKARLVRSDQLGRRLKRWDFPSFVICFGTSSSRFHPCLMSFICCADHGSVIDFNVEIIEIDLFHIFDIFRHFFMCVQILLQSSVSRAVWCAGSDPGRNVDRVGQHRPGIISAWTDWVDVDSWTRHLWFELCIFEPRVLQLCWRFGDIAML